MTNYRENTRLITPPKEEEEVYPYRRAWSSVIIESAILVIAASVLFVLGYFLGLRPPDQFVQPLNVGLALLPLALWLIFSRWRENFAVQPRRRLMTVCVITALVANAIGIPLVEDFLRPAEWLSLESATTRIIGYTITMGIVQEFLKYLVLRYTVWPDYYRVRTDAVAYGAASAVGYATVANLHYVVGNFAAPDVAVLRILNITAVHLIASIVLSYGLSETRFSRAPIFLLPASLLAAAAVTGVAIPLRAGLVNAALALTVSTTRPYLGLGFSIVLIVGPLLAMIFLFNVSERRERDAMQVQEN